MAKHSRTGVESGASDLGAIVPVNGEYLSPFGNSPNDILKRHRAAQDGVDAFSATRVMEGGNRFEDATRQWFEDDFNQAVKHPKRGYRNKKCNLVASLDGIIDSSPGAFVITDYQGVEHVLDVENGIGVVDFKCPTFQPDNPEALHYVMQMQGQMDCAGASWAIIAYLPRINLEWVIAVIKRHQGTINAIYEAVDIFWGHMENDTNYPPSTTTEANKLIGGNRRPEALDLIEGCPDESPIDANGRDELMNLAESYTAGVKTKKAGERLKEESQLAIQHILNGVERVKLPGVNVNWSTTEYRGQAEKTKITPAKPAFTTRRFSLKEIDNV